MNKKHIIIILLIIGLLIPSLYMLNKLYISKYSKEINNFKEAEYESFLQGDISFDIPHELLANEAETLLLKDSNKVSFSVKEKKTTELSHMTVKADYNNKEYNYQAFSNNQTALLFNGIGWFSYLEKPQLVEITTSQVLNEVLKNQDGLKTKFSREKIVFNSKEYDSYTNEITLSDKSIQNISEVYKINIVNSENITPKIKIYSINKDTHIIEFNITLEKKTPYETNIKFKVEGSLFLDKTKKPEIIKPQTSNVYDNSADFLLDLILK